MKICCPSYNIWLAISLLSTYLFVLCVFCHRSEKEGYLFPNHKLSNARESHERCERLYGFQN